MNIELSKHGEAIMKAYNDVVSDKTPTDWVLYGYEGQTNILKVVGSGEDGLEELAEDLNTSKIMYAIVKITDPKTTRSKIILIDWQGEGAPIMRKGHCARHLPDLQKIFKVHMTINARTEEEVEPDAIIEAVGKATATSYDFSDRSEVLDKNAPVGTNYKRTNPLSEINSNVRNKFWEEQEAEEKKRKELEIKKREEELIKMEKLRLEREIEDAKQREAVSKERNARILSEKRAEAQADKNMSKATSETEWQKELERQQQEERERARRAEQMRTERKKEAESLIGHKMHTTRSLFEGKQIEQSPPSSQDKTRPPPRKLKEFKPANFDNGSEPNSPPTSVSPRSNRKNMSARWPPVEPEKAPSSPPTIPGRICDKEMPIEPTTVTEPKNTIREFEEKNRIEEIAQRHTVTNNIFKIQNGSTSNTNGSVKSYTSNSNSNSNYSPSKISSNIRNSTKTSPSLPICVTPEVNLSQGQRHVTEVQQEKHNEIQKIQSISNGSHKTYVEETIPSKVATQSYEPQPTQHIYNSPPVESPKSPLSPTNNFSHRYDVPPEEYHSPTEPYSNGANGSNGSPELYTTVTTNSLAMTYEVDGIEYQILQEHGLCARALYDYQAADETEITFDPGEIITNIDQIADGWWRGIGPNGTFGLFPANYVELINAIA